jgi:hypothetical protein
MKKWKLKNHVTPKMLVGFSYELNEDEFDSVVINATKEIVFDGEREKIYIEFSKQSPNYRAVEFDYIPLNNKYEVTPFIQDLIDAELVEEELK